MEELGISECLASEHTSRLLRGLPVNRNVSGIPEMLDCTSKRGRENGGTQLRALLVSARGRTQAGEMQSISKNGKEGKGAGRLF